MRTIEVPMPPCQEVIEGLVALYARGPHTATRRAQLMVAVCAVLDYFIEVKHDERAET